MEAVLNALPAYVLLFAAFSVAGWVMEVVLKYIQYRRFINRGFLIGPYCPIYGWGALLITLAAGGVFYRKCTVAETFLVGFLLCGTLEYAVSWCMEKTSHARWWDYSNKPMNLNGRVWIGNLLLFGLAAVGIVYVADPALFSLFARIPARARQIIAAVFVAVIVADQIVSSFLTKVVRGCIEHQQADDTEAIRQEMHRMLRDRTLLTRRISRAYPDLMPIPSRLRDGLRAARAEYRAASKRLRTEVRQAERAADSRRRKASREALAALRTSVGQAKAAQQRAREKLRAIEGELFGGRK